MSTATANNIRLRQGVYFKRGKITKITSSLSWASYHHHIQRYLVLPTLLICLNGPQSFLYGLSCVITAKFNRNPPFIYCPSRRFFRVKYLTINYNSHHRILTVVMVRLDRLENDACVVPEILFGLVKNALFVIRIRFIISHRILYLSSLAWLTTLRIFT